VTGAGNAPRARGWRILRTLTTTTAQPHPGSALWKAWTRKRNRRRSRPRRWRKRRPRSATRRPPRASRRS